jgi:hypothetical protein
MEVAAYLRGGAVVDVTLPGLVLKLLCMPLLCIIVFKLIMDPGETYCTEKSSRYRRQHVHSRWKKCSTTVLDYCEAQYSAIHGGPQPTNQPTVGFVGACAERCMILGRSYATHTHIVHHDWSV